MLNSMMIPQQQPQMDQQPLDPQYQALQQQLSGRQYNPQGGAAGMDPQQQRALMLSGLIGGIGSAFSGQGDPTSHMANVMDLMGRMTERHHTQARLDFDLETELLKSKMDEMRKGIQLRSQMGASYDTHLHTEQATKTSAAEETRLIAETGRIPGQIALTTAQKDEANALAGLHGAETDVTKERLYQLREQALPNLEYLQAKTKEQEGLSSKALSESKKIDLDKVILEQTYNANIKKEEAIQKGEMSNDPTLQEWARRARTGMAAPSEDPLYRIGRTDAVLAERLKIFKDLDNRPRDDWGGESEQSLTLRHASEFTSGIPDSLADLNGLFGVAERKQVDPKDRNDQIQSYERTLKFWSNPTIQKQINADPQTFAYYQINYFPGLQKMLYPLLPNIDLANDIERTAQSPGMIKTQVDSVKKEVATHDWGPVLSNLTKRLFIGQKETKNPFYSGTMEFQRKGS